MVDLKIEYRPERFFYTNVRYWWRLPKFRDAALCFSTKGQSRVTEEGFISVPCVADEKGLRIRIPSDGQVVSAALMSGSTGFDAHYYSEKGRVGPYQNLGVSDKGRYLQGFIELFPSLWHASEFCKNRFWRTVLESMCRTTADSGRLIPVRNRLGKILPKWMAQFSRSPEEVTNALSQLIVNQAKELKHVAREITFNSLLDQLTKERREFKQKEEYRDFDADEEGYRQDLEESLSDLTARGVFFQGIKPRCIVCGSRFWYDAEEIKRKLTCKSLLPPVTGYSQRKLVEYLPARIDEHRTLWKGEN